MINIVTRDGIRLVRTETRLLERYLWKLPKRAWTKPSACDKWQVRDVVAHLAGGAQFYDDMVSRGLKGDSSPPPDRPPRGTITAAQAAEGIAQRAISLRESLGDQVLLAFSDNSLHLTKLFASLGPEELEKPCYHPIGVIPARDFIGLRIFELALHGWDIRSRLEESAHLSNRSLISLLASLPRALQWIFQVAPGLPSPTRYRLEGTGNVPVQKDILVEGGKARLEPAGKARADVTFRCTTEAFILLMYGRLDLSSALASGDISATGDPKLVKEFGQRLHGI